jgi:hypothetical protein
MLWDTVTHSHTAALENVVLSFNVHLTSVIFCYTEPDVDDGSDSQALHLNRIVTCNDHKSPRNLPEVLIGIDRSCHKPSSIPVPLHLNN